MKRKHPEKTTYFNYRCLFIFNFIIHFIHIVAKLINTVEYTFKYVLMHYTQTEQLQRKINLFLLVAYSFNCCSCYFKLYIFMVLVEKGSIFFLQGYNVLYEFSPLIMLHITQYIKVRTIIDSTIPRITIGVSA